MYESLQVAISLYINYNFLHLYHLTFNLTINQMCSWKHLGNRINSCNQVKNMSIKLKANSNVHQIWPKH